VISRPLIGVSTSELRPAEGAHFAHHSEPPRRMLALGVTYLDAVAAAGGIPVILAPLPARRLEAIIERLDGVCLSGGPDIEPATYGSDAHPELGPTEPEVDLFELGLVRAARRRGLPILAICRGMQVLNVALGGDLVAHIPDHYGDDVLHRHPERRPVEHPVRIEPASRIGRILGTDELSVRSWHHQAVGRIGHGLRAVAWAPDGVVEAVESDEHPCTLAVQWHPEVRALADPRHLRLFEALVEAAGGARTGAVMTWDRDSDSPLAEEPGRKSLRRTTGTAGAR
jgi:putative glutamine amidotransferase